SGDSAAFTRYSGRGRACRLPDCSGRARQRSVACRSPYLFKLWLDAALNLEVVDDGHGLPDSVRAGVGLVSMRERAAELGGSCTIDSAAGGGTRVLARLPLADSAEDDVLKAPAGRLRFALYSLTIIDSFAMAFDSS